MSADQVRIHRSAKQVGQAYRQKLHNRRVMARRLSDGTTEFKFKRLTSEGIATQSIVLTDGAVQAMHVLWMVLIRSNNGVTGVTTAGRNVP